MKCTGHALWISMSVSPEERLLVNTGSVQILYYSYIHLVALLCFEGPHPLFFFFKDFLDVNHFLSLYYVCYNIAFVLCFCSCFFWHGFLAPQLGIKPTPPALEDKVSTTGWPRKSQVVGLLKKMLKESYLKCKKKKRKITHWLCMGSLKRIWVNALLEGIIPGKQELGKK